MNKRGKGLYTALSFALFLAGSLSSGAQGAATKPSSGTTPSPAPAAAKQSAPASTTPQTPAQQQQPTAQGSQKIPSAQLLWSVVPDKNASELLPTEAENASLRGAVLAGDRIVAVYEASSEISRGGRPLRTFRILSLDQKSGGVKDRKEIQGQSLPFLFATGDDHIVLAQPSLTRLNPDLTESGEHFAETGLGRTTMISPDGSVLAHLTVDGTELLSATSLTLIGVRIKGTKPSAVGKRSILSDDAQWASQFPQDLAFVARIDEQEPHLLFHGKCGGKPVYLSERKILFIGCGKANVIDLSGNVLRQFSLGATYGSFAGVSRDGSRFAILSTDSLLGDPNFNSAELFTIYNSESYEPVATVQPEKKQDARSWSAFSGDGKLFICGGAKKLNLYKIP
jgi:hypothetical protein